MKTRHADAAFDGEGARINGGRWNSPGRPAVYASGSRALATLEVLAGVGTAGVLTAYSLIEVSFGAQLVEELDPHSLPEGWDARPPTAVSQGLGDAWLVAGSSIVLQVPSVVVPAESNYLLNPLHPDFGLVSIGAPEAAIFDPRL